MQQIRDFDKDIPIVITTGNVPALLNLDFTKLTNVGILEKPFQMRELLEIIDRLK